MKHIPQAFASRAAAAFHLDETNGKFYKVITARDGSRVITDDEAGTMTPVGIRLQFEGRYFQAHHLAWFIAHGSWPTHKVTHLDGDVGDNRPGNLASPLSLKDHEEQRNNELKDKAAAAMGFMKSIGITEEMIQDHALETIRKNQGEETAIEVMHQWGRIDNETRKAMVQDVRRTNKILGKTPTK